MYPFIVNNFILPVSDKILGLSLSKELKKWRKIQWYSKGELEEMQLMGLKNILSHCNKNIPYYKRVFQKVGYDGNENPVNELKKIPFLTKKIIKENLPVGILDKTRKTYFIDYTSGSSGIQGEFYSDKIAFSIATAIHILWREWAGYQLGNKLIQTGMTLDRGFVKKVKDILFRVKYTQAFEMDTEEISKKLQSVRKVKDMFFMGYASALYAYAKVCKESGIDDVQFKAVLSWGDKMFSHYRSIIESTFNTKVFSTYAANEGTMIAAECEEHNYHVMTPHVFIELLDNNGNEVKPGEIGEVVVTRLDNYLMPLIRYHIGDLAVKSDANKKCGCGRQFPMLERIIGRDTDIVYTPGRKSLIVHFFTGIFEYYREIEQFQVIQSKNLAIRINYIKGSGFEESILVKIKNEMYEKANEKFPFEYICVDKIKPLPSGKPQIIIQE